MRIGYCVHNLNDAAVERRCRMFEAGGGQVVLAGFCRDETVGPAAKSRGAIMLGQSRDAAFLSRAAMTARQALFPSALKTAFADCDVVVARNLEQLAIVRSVVEARPLVYECLDIHRSLTGTSVPARILQRIEGALLPRVDLLITSSPAFLRHYFDHRPLDAPRLVVENKLLDLEGGGTLNSASITAAPPMTIGWFGMLRCKRTLAFLTDLAQRSAGTVEILIAGKPSPAELPDLAEIAARTDGVNFTGPYSYADLPELYGRCDFAWTIDWFEEGQNSTWLLPNRLYEAIAFGAVPIALANVEVGHWLQRHDAGLVVQEADAAADTILSMDAAELGQYKRQVAAIDRGDVICGPAECRDLVARLRTLVR